MNKLIIEGYWYSSQTPEYPFPESVNFNNQEFISKLEHLQLLARKKSYRGMSRCRICEKMNGSEEYTDLVTNTVWPSGYLHYIRDHGVSPSEEFFNLVMNDRRLNNV